MSDPRFPRSDHTSGEAREPLDATGEDPSRSGEERAPRRAVTEQLPAARPYLPLPDEGAEDEDEPTASLEENAPPRPAPPRRANTEPLQPVSTPRTPVPPRGMRQVGPDPWAAVPDGLHDRSAPPVAPLPPKPVTPPPVTRELRAPDPTGARSIATLLPEDEAFEVTDPVDPRELERVRERSRATAADAEVAGWTAPPAENPRWERSPRRRARAERLPSAPSALTGVPDAPGPVHVPSQAAVPSGVTGGEAPLPPRSAPASKRPVPLPTPPPPVAPTPPRRMSMARLFQVDYRDNEKTAVEPVTFKPPPFWKVFPERPEWWFVLSLLAVLLMGGALVWRLHHKARTEELARIRAEQEALPPWMRGPAPPPPPPGMVLVPTASGHELQAVDPGPAMPRSDQDEEGAPPSAADGPPSGAEPSDAAEAPSR